MRRTQPLGRPGAVWVTFAMAASLALLSSDSSASPRKAEIQAHIDQLDDPDYQARCRSLINAKHKLPGWIRNADPEDGNGSGAIDPCTDEEHVRTVLVSQFVRSPGAPDELTVPFKTRARGEICLRVANNGVAAATVEVNGDELLHEFDFNATVTDLVASKELDAGEHELAVTLASAPGSALLIEIRAALAEDLVQIVQLFLVALSDAGPSDAVVRATLSAASTEGGALEDVQEVLGEIASGRSGNFASITTAQAVRAFGVQTAELYDVGDPELDAALTELANILYTARAGTVRSAAAQAIGGLGHPDGVAALEAALQTELSAIVFLAIQNALVNLDATLPEVP